MAYVFLILSTISCIYLVGLYITSIVNRNLDTFRIVVYNGYKESNPPLYKLETKLYPWEIWTDKLYIHKFIHEINWYPRYGTYANDFSSKEDIIEFLGRWTETQYKKRGVKIDISKIEIVDKRSNKY